MEGAVLVSRHYNIQCIVEDYYGLVEFLRQNVYHEKERCAYCYERRLMKTAEKAKELGMDAFSSSLLYSKMQTMKLSGNWQTKQQKNMIYHFTITILENAGRKVSIFLKILKYTGKITVAAFTAKKTGF